MWLEIDFESMTVNNEGFVEKKLENSALFYNSGLNQNINSIKDLISTEYLQVIEINLSQRSAVFGRDYLGHFPLLYSSDGNSLFITDELREAIEWLKARGKQLTISKEALALYFTMSYVPQGMTIYNEIASCENASMYTWSKGKVIREKLFEPIFADSEYPLEELGKNIEYEVDRLSKDADHVDVWCSGGLDSSIIGVLCNEGNRKADLVTLTYASQIRDLYGEGELPYAQEVADFSNTALRTVQLDKETYIENYHNFARSHITPTMDLCVTPKYSLASISKGLVMTGEGADPLFSGVKNDSMLFTAKKHPHEPIGWLYCLAHKRFAGRLEDIFVDSSGLKDFIIEYFGEKLSEFPGDLLRKLFYANTFIKQGGMIFPEGYYSTKRHGVSSRHPLSALSVYESAFKLTDDKKYIFPTGKLALINLYKERIPISIIERRKSGTKLPLQVYMDMVKPFVENLEMLRSCGLFKESLLDMINQPHSGKHSDNLLKHGLITLENWFIGHH
jgi:asparagine synthetase B (glutamine-hydrolysing)